MQKVYVVYRIALLWRNSPSLYQYPVSVAVQGEGLESRIWIQHMKSCLWGEILKTRAQFTVMWNANITEVLKRLDK